MSKALVDSSDIGNDEDGKFGKLILDCFSRSNDTVPAIPARQDLRLPAARTDVCNHSLLSYVRARNSMEHV